MGRRLGSGLVAISMVLGFSLAAGASPTETGETGLVTIPTTDVLPPWGVSAGTHWNGEATVDESINDDRDLNKLQVTWGLGLIPNLEVTGQIPIVFYTRQQARDKREAGQARFGLKYRLLDEKNGAPLSAAILGGVAIGSGQPFFPTIQDRNSLYGRREVWEVMAIVDKVIANTRAGDAVLTLNAGGLFFDKPRASQFSLSDQTVPFRRRFSGNEVTFDTPFEWGMGLKLPVVNYGVGKLDFTGEWRGNTGTVDQLRGTIPMQLFSGFRWSHESGFDLQGGADFGLSGQIDGYRYLVSVAYATPPEAPPPSAPVAQPPPPPPAPQQPQLIRKKIVLRGVHFDFDKATIRSDSEAILNEAVSTLKENPGVRVEVVGHTDSMGTEEYNDNLSVRRANAVKDYLVRHGISAGRLNASGKGERDPVASNDTEEGRAQNRRVELKVIE